jgi:hypothetical protein
MLIATGYDEYVTGRRHMAREGDRHADKDVELPLDGVGGVNIVVKADVHKSGESPP